MATDLQQMVARYARKRGIKLVLLTDQVAERFSDWRRIPHGVDARLVEIEPGLYDCQIQTVPGEQPSRQGPPSREEREKLSASAAKGREIHDKENPGWDKSPGWVYPE